MRNAVRTYVHMKPTPRIIAAQSSWGMQWLYSPRLVAGALVVALFASTAGISYAAEDSLPGDALYTVKTNINEPIQGALAVSAQAKSDWAIDVASTRLQEAATLAAEGKLSTSTQAELEQNFDAHAQQAAAIIAEQASTSPDTGVTSAVSFEAQLSEYQRVLTQVGAATDSQTGSIASAVAQTQAQVGTIRADAQAKVALAATTSSTSQTLAASRMRDIAKQQLEVSLKLASDSDDSIDSSSAAQVATQLADASTTISQGDVLLASNSAPEASGAFQSALASAQKLGVFLQTSSAIHARTGLTIGDAASAKTTSTSTHRTLRTAAATAPTAAPTAAMTTLSATATTSATSTANTTTDEDNTTVNVSTQTTESSNTSDNTQTQPSPAAPATLPISVPTNVLP